MDLGWREVCGGESMNSETQYGYLTTITWSGIVNVSRIVMGYGHEHNWNTQLIHKPRGKILVQTDQTIELQANFEYDLKRYKEVHFGGQVIYRDWRFWRVWL